MRLALTCRSECRAYCEYPCPCGYAGDPEKECTCSPTLISHYQKRLSGPLLDRIDIHIEVPRVPFQKLSDPRSANYAARGRCDRRGEPSAAIRGQVEGARARQAARFAAAVGADNHPPLHMTNADMGSTEVRDYCGASDAGRQLLGTAMRHTCPGAARQGKCQGMQPSARAYHRILRPARTIAGLAGAERIQPTRIAETIQYRPRRQGQLITRRSIG